MNKRYLLLITAVFFPICAIAALLWYVDYQENLAWEAYLALPLPNDVVIDLCSRNLIPSNLADCTGDTASIKQSIMPEVFRANLNSTATYQDVTDKFAEYQFYCDKDMHENDSEYSCQYRFGSYDVVLIFDRATDRITRLISETSGS